MSLVRLNIKGISYSQTQNGAYALLLSEVDGEKQLPIVIGAFEAQSIAIALHRECIIALQSNPTTGYTWTLSIEPAGVITTKPKEFIANASDRVEVGGTTSWLLMANRVGSTTLTFHYQRPWETGVKPTREVVYKFKVY